MTVIPSNPRCTLPDDERQGWPDQCHGVPYGCSGCLTACGSRTVAIQGVRDEAPPSSTILYSSGAYKQPLWSRNDSKSERVVVGASGSDSESVVRGCPVTAGLFAPSSLFHRIHSPHSITGKKNSSARHNGERASSICPNLYTPHTSTTVDSHIDIPLPKHLVPYLGSCTKYLSHSPMDRGRICRIPFSGYSPLSDVPLA